MANNRMYLVYRPTGEAVYLGKRMGWGWYGTPDDVAERISTLFDRAERAAEEGPSQDDFAIAMDSGERQPHVIDKWVFGTPGEKVCTLTIDPSVPYGDPERV